jgi:O-antigen/teichoic acid export membrane protein
MARSRLATHGLAYLGARAVQLLAYVAVMPIVTRQLDETGYGTVALALVVFQALAAVAPLGLTSVVAWSLYEKEPDAERRAQRLLVATAGIATALAAAAWVTGPVWSQLFSGLGFDGPFQLAVLLVVPVTVQAAALSIFQAQGRPVAFVATTLVVTVGGQGLGLALLIVRDTPSSYLAGVLAGAVAGALLALALLPLRTVRPASFDRVRAAVQHGGPTVAHLLGFMVLALADRVLVERVLGIDAAARYQVSYVVGSVGSVVLYGLNNAWAPMVYADTDDGRWRTLTTTSVPVAWLVGVLVAAVGLAAPVGLRILAPPSYAPEELAGVAALVAAATLFDFVYLASVMVLFKRKRTAVLLLAMPLAALVNVGLNVLLLPIWGLTAAAAATVVGYALLAGLVGLASRRQAAVPWNRPALAEAGVTGLVGVGLALVLPTSGAGLVVRLALVAVLAGVALSRSGSLVRLAPRRRAAFVPG